MKDFVEILIKNFSSSLHKFFLLLVLSEGVCSSLYIFYWIFLSALWRQNSFDEIANKISNETSSNHFVWFFTYIWFDYIIEWHLRLQSPTFSIIYFCSFYWFNLFFLSILIINLLTLPASTTSSNVSSRIHFRDWFLAIKNETIFSKLFSLSIRIFIKSKRIEFIFTHDQLLYRMFFFFYWMIINSRSSLCYSQMLKNKN
jgi:hypothetical protein